MKQGMKASRRFFTRRRVLSVGAMAVLAPPVGAVTALKLKDNPLPPVAEPDLVLVNGWLLDAGDLRAGDGK